MNKYLPLYSFLNIKLSTSKNTILRNVNYLILNSKYGKIESRFESKCIQQFVPTNPTKYNNNSNENATWKILQVKFFKYLPNSCQRNNWLQFLSCAMKNNINFSRADRERTFEGSIISKEQINYQFAILTCYASRATFWDVISIFYYYLLLNKLGLTV